MTKQQIVEKVNHFLVEEFEIDPAVIAPEAPLKETLDLDSLDYVDMLVVIESNFGIKLATRDFKDLNTFDDFYNYISEKMKVPTNV